MSNRAQGDAFERQLCDLLASYGFWAHRMKQTESGQPADIIAVKNDMAALIDCKVCSYDKFAYSRVEPNQKTAMRFWTLCGNDRACFAMKLRDETIWMVKYSRIAKCFKDNGGSAMDCDQIKRYGEPLETWLERFNV